MIERRYAGTRAWSTFGVLVGYGLGIVEVVDIQNLNVGAGSF